MNISQFGQLQNLLHGFSPLEVIGNSSTVKKSQQRVESILGCIDLVRQLRAHCVHPHLNDATCSIGTVSRDLSGQIRKLCKDRQVAPLSERHMLEQEVMELVDSAPTNTLASNLIQHGRIIRSLIYLLDKQVIKLMGESDALYLAGEYNEKWMRIMSAIEALTQYRIALSDTQCISLLRVTGRGMVLESKLKEIQETVNLYQFEQSDALDHLDQINHYHGLRGTEEAIVRQIYQLSSRISALLLEAYRSVIIETCDQIKVSDEREWSA